MRRLLVSTMVLAIVAVGLAAPVSAKADKLSPQTGGSGWWLAGDDAGDEVAGSSGKATVNKNGATVTVRTTGLPKGHAFTAWLVYFNDGPNCVAPEGGPPATNCGFGDLVAGNGGIVRLGGKVIGGSGQATFSGRLNVGDGPEIGPPGVVAYAPVSPDFHVVVRSHGPKVPAEMPAQIHTVGGGCVGDDVPEGQIPDEPGECGDVQVFIFETEPAS